MNTLLATSYKVCITRGLWSILHWATQQKTWLWVLIHRINVTTLNFCRALCAWQELFFITVWGPEKQSLNWLLVQRDWIFYCVQKKKAAQQPSLTLWGLEAWVTAYRFAPRCRVQTVCSDPSSRSHKEIGIWVCSFKYHMGWYLHTLASNVVLKLRYPLHTLVYTADYNKITPSLHLLTEEKGGLGMHIWNSLCLILLIWSLQNDLAVLTPAQLSELQTVSKPGILCHSTTTAQTAVLSNRSM